MNITILDHDQNPMQQRVSPETSWKTASVDIDRYQELLDAPGLSDQEKQDLLQALWTLIVSLVDLGYRIHPLQMASNENPSTKREAKQTVQEQGNNLQPD